MNKNFNNFVESQLHVNEEDFNNIINSLPSIIKNKENLDFSEYDNETSYIEEYLLNQYIVYKFDASIDAIDSSSKTVWIFTYKPFKKENLELLKSQLEDWRIENYIELENNYYDQA